MPALHHDALRCVMIPEQSCGVMTYDSLVMSRESCFLAFSSSGIPSRVLHLRHAPLPNLHAMTCA